MMASISKDSEKCKKCVRYSECDSKMMEACAEATEKRKILVSSVVQPYTMPIVQDMEVKHDYRNIKVAENTVVTIDLEEMKEKLASDIYKEAVLGIFPGA